MRKLLVSAFILSISSLSSAALARPERRDVRVRVRVPAATYRVRVAPPIVREEVRVAAPSPRHVWVPGYWNWYRHRHVWVRGRWALPPRGFRVWIAPRWVNDRGFYVLYPGYWSDSDAPAYDTPSGYDDAEIYSDSEPPAPQVEVMPVAPSPSHVWIAGHWGWHGRRYEWVPGRWEPARAGFHWEVGRWDRDDRRWRWRPGRWIHD